MSTPTYHHLLVINDWQIDANMLFLTEEEIEPALRRIVKVTAEHWNFGEPVLEEILSTENLDDLRCALEDHDVAIYVDTLEAPEVAR